MSKNKKENRITSNSTLRKQNTYSERLTGFRWTKENSNSEAIFLS